MTEQLPEKIQPLVHPKAFSYQKPAEHRKGNKEVVLLCKTPTMRGSVHVIRKGGGEHLHSHKTVDGFWMVLSGTVRFYDEDNQLFGEFGPLSGILMPRNNRYWFESVGEDDAEILQVLHFDHGQGFQRDDHEEPKFDRKGIRMFSAGQPLAKKCPAKDSSGTVE